MADDDVADSWEDADTEDLERRMEERRMQLEAEKKRQTKSKQKQQPSQEQAGGESDYASGIVPLEVQTQLPLRIQDSNRTEYVAPIKILKRQGDPKAGSSPASQQSSSSSTTTSNKQHKSLAEREAEYASARARILGTDYRSEDTTPSAQSRVAVITKESSSDGVKRHPKGPNGTKGFKN